MKAMNVGLVGCGMIRKPYIQVCGESKWLNLAACADLRQDRAEDACKQADENGWGRPVPASFEDMLANPEIDIIMNVTNPKAHYPLNIKALEAGKHVHAEKPLCLTRDEGKKLLDAASANNVRLSCAPDTFLGDSHQTARALIDSGAIGTPTAGTLFFMGGGPDGYHEFPELFYQAGAGPMFDIGVYSLTMAINLLGPISRVSAMTKKTWEQRKNLKEESPGFGEMFDVEVPTHVTGLLEFENNVIVTFVTSFDIKGGQRLPYMEVYGTEGTISTGNPNNFNDTVAVKRCKAENPEWEDAPMTNGYSGKSRGIAAADIAAAVAYGRPHRASGELAYHVLDVGLSLYEAADSGKTVAVESTVERPLAMPEGVTPDITE